MGKISWTERVSNDEVLRILGEENVTQNLQREAKEADRTYL